MDNVYNTPQADLETEGNKLVEFYSVSLLKFTTLFFITLGLYAVYWNYKNWSSIKTKKTLKMWPLARGIFAIFFINSLLKRVDERLKDSQIAYSWKPTLIAIMYIVLTVVSDVCDQLAEREIGAPLTFFVSILLLPFIWFYLKKAQVAINLAVGDPDGRANSQFTPANIFWIVLGLIFWLLVILGLLDSLGIVNLDS